MSRHVWLVKRFTDRLLERAVDAWRHARQGGCLSGPATQALGVTQALRFVGYAEEMTRQKSDPASVCELWTGVVNSQHLYASGVNRDNYRRAGLNLICTIIDRGYRGVMPTDVERVYSEFRLDEGCWPVLHDALEDAGMRDVIDFIENGEYPAWLHESVDGRRRRRR